MISTSACLMFLAVILKESVEESVKQTEGLVTVTEGNKVTLNCTYELSGFIYPFWYIQDPGQPPRLLLRDFGKDDSDEGHLRSFSATHEKTQKTFNLEKASSQLNDSAVYFCATVEQSEGLEIIPQGSKLSLKCSYQSSFMTNYPFWYIQHPGQAPKLLMAEFAKELSNEGHLRGFSAIHEKNKKTFNLEKAAIQLNDSAAYFCAVSDTVRLANREAEQKLAKDRKTEQNTEQSIQGSKLLI
ncbi:uncharacterized protein LOC118095717 [Zootoca vivipara]|uniref:uncharacterized protein LOC118095717 n=1 Tax=Zootoca vivipara TaxID=8524 RepID=UPI00293BC0C9|nr:uncharacterized protein LOC118095717 [Zootoca vivipara]